MNGRASAELICKAKAWNKHLAYEGYCGNVRRPEQWTDAP